ncbi:MAG: phosphotransferase [Gammaproteobacteria bacterium]|nr:phosphotransferase [Gammaproteobacteria bacterium]
MNVKDHDERFLQLRDWLSDTVELRDASIVPASGDASFRRYFRVLFRDLSYIAMDAPPDKENCRPFVDVARAFCQIGLHVPEILAEDLDQGFLLLSDLGNQQYLDHLNSDSVDDMYNDAMDALVVLQQKGKQEDHRLPDYNHELLLREMNLFPDWFLAKHIGIDISASEKDALHSVFEALAQSALSQPQVWVHRDYHSRNLMLLDENNPGILDFQDAVYGAVTYDLVSLLRDCYIDWPVDRTMQWVNDFRERLQKADVIEQTDPEQFQRWFDWMGTQRHLKAIGIFARLNYRDGKSGYLKDIPRTLGYVMHVVERYSELAPLGQIIKDKVLPVFDMQTGLKK